MLPKKIPITATVKTAELTDSTISRYLFWLTKSIGIKNADIENNGKIRITRSKRLAVDHFLNFNTQMTAQIKYARIGMYGRYSAADGRPLAKACPDKVINPAS